MIDPNTVWKVNKYFRENSISECLLANEGVCSENIIRAHSIQNSFVIDQLEKSGHVNMIQYTNDGKLSFKKVGRNQATTFLGYCSHHDNSLFAPIDLNQKNTFDIKNDHQRILFALRSISIELWKKRNILALCDLVINAFKKGNQSSLKGKLSFTDNELNALSVRYKDIFVPMKIGTKNAITDLEYTFRSLLTQIRQGNYHQTLTHHLSFMGTPTIAVSSAFHPEFCPNGNRIVDLTRLTILPSIFLSIFPNNGTTEVLLSYNRKFRNDIQKFLLPLESAPEKEQRVLVSKIVVLYAENAVFSPEFIESLDDEKKAYLIEKFEETAVEETKFSRIEDDKCSLL